MNDVERRKAMEPMQGKWASSQVHLGYIKLFFLPDVTPLFFSFWEFSWGLFGLPSSKSRLLTCLTGNMVVLCVEFKGIEPHLSARWKSDDFLELQQEHGVHYRVTVGMAIENSFVQQCLDSCLVTMDTSGI